MLRRGARLRAQVARRIVMPLAFTGVLAAALGPGSAWSEAATPSGQNTTAAQMSSFLPAPVDGKPLPGVTVMARAKGLGTPRAHTDLASAVTGVPPIADPASQAVFEIGSLTKVFTGLVAAVAVEEGRLALSTTLGEMLGERLQGAPPDVQAITVAQLLTHRSCLPRLSDKVLAQADADAYAAINAEDLWRDLRKQPSQDRRDCPEAYSNFGMSVLGQAIAVHLKSPYADLVHTMITQPLGMKDTLVPGPQGSTRLVAAFDGHAPSGRWTFDAYMPAGGMHSTARDLLRLAEAYVTPPPGVLGRAIARSVKPLSPSSMARAMGWGLFINGEGEQVSYFHDGRTRSFATMWAVKPSSREALVVLTSNVKATTQAAQAARVVTNEWYPLSTVSSTVATAELAATATDLAKWAGVYAIDDKTRFTFVVHQGRLWGRLTNQGFNALEATSPSSFVLREVGAEFVFAADAQSVVLKQAGNTVPGKRAGPAPQLAIMDEATAASYAGTYKQGPLTFVVRAHQGQLVVKLDNQPFFNIYPVQPPASADPKAVRSEERFDYEVVQASIVFERDAQGQVQTLTLLQGGQRVRAQRQQP